MAKALINCAGIYAPAQYLPSPHWNERPDPTDISLLVIHNISLPPGEFGSNCITDFFLGQLDLNCYPQLESLRDLKVSAHHLITRTGEVIQYVPYLKRAWHAGVSEFQGRPQCNDYSIGIELEGTDHLPYTPTQYAALIRLTQALQQAYPAITLDRIVGHCDIAPHRKTDPGQAFDWDYYRQHLSGNGTQ